MSETVLIPGTKVSQLGETIAETKATPAERIKKFSALRARDRDFAEWLKAHDPETAAAVERCGSGIVMRHYHSVGETRVKAILPEFCRKRFLCSMCDAIRAGKTLGKYVDRVLSVLREYKWQHCCYLVTFTVKDGEDLGERVRHLRDGYREVMARRRRFKASTSKRTWRWTEAGKALGGMHSVEVKRGENSGLWHPHLHAVWVCEDEPEQWKLREEWSEICGDSWVVDVRRFHSMEMSDGMVIADREGLGKDLCEVVKYSLKFSDLEFEDQFHASRVLRKAMRAMRLFGSFGCLWGLKEENIECDTLLEQLDAEMKYVDLLFGWDTRARQYACSNIARGGVNVLTGEEVYRK